MKSSQFLIAGKIVNFIAAANVDDPNTPKGNFILWTPVIIGLAALYIPSLYDLFNGIWSQDEQLHGPIVLSISCWLLYMKWPLLVDASKSEPKNNYGWLFCIFGAITYALGRSQSILTFEMGSVIPFLIGIGLLTLGTKAVKIAAFALFFMIFMIPLPAAFVDTVTMPMKMAVSSASESTLYYLGYPISRTGVTLEIGQYKLLVADACAGLHTLLTLEALGLLYLNLNKRGNAFRNIGIAILIVPISFASNVIRVMSLSLITYHFGDAAGQGFLHKFAGFVLFLSALLLILSIDAALLWVESHFIKNIKLRERSG